MKHGGGTHLLLEKGEDFGEEGEFGEDEDKLRTSNHNANIHRKSLECE
jgi:hypothetical protein